MNCKNGKKVVLMYHRVNDTWQDYNRITVNEKNFRTQMLYLKENFKVLSLKDMLEYEGENDVIAITFDDGFADFYTKALPVLEEMNLPAVVFVTTGKIDSEEELWTSEIIRLLYMNDSECDEINISFMGKKICLSIASLEQRARAYQCIRQIIMGMPGNKMNEIIAELREQLGMDAKGRESYSFLSAEQCKKLGEHPLITVGAHTVNHISMGNVEDVVLEYEVKNSIGQLEHLIGKKIEYFAYPFGGKGDYSKSAIRLLKDCGIKAAFTTHNSDYQKDLHGTYEIPRVYIGNWNMDRFAKCLDSHFKAEKVFVKEFQNKADFYMGRLEDDIKLQTSESPIIIWGTGIRGRHVKEWLTKAGMAERIMAFADNNVDLWGGEVEGINVYSLTQLESNKNALFIVYNAVSGKIIKQLVDMGIEKLHWIV